jgi:3-phosphoshikimate 1-carboxyvinyltransferase
VGYPPLRVEGTSIKGGTVVVDGSVSSQFITALLLIAPSFTQGLQLRISKATSIPYIKMTYRMLQELGVSCSWEQVPAGDLHIHVEATKQLTSQIAYVESDWSSAGYWYSWVAMQDAGYSITLDHYREDSLQGDRRLQEIYASLGVDTSFKQGSMQLLKTDLKMPAQLDLDLRDVPDQAQTIFATCLGLGINAHFTGLQTLKIKETDRIEAMQVVGSRFRESEITTTDHSITLKMDPNSPFTERVEVDTYHDHRMALAFAPLCVKTSVIIKDAGVVSKSYGAYWDDLKALNVCISER